MTRHTRLSRWQTRERRSLHRGVAIAAVQLQIPGVVAMAEKHRLPYGHQNACPVGGAIHFVPDVPHSEKKNRENNQEAAIEKIRARTKNLRCILAIVQWQLRLFVHEFIRWEEPLLSDGDDRF